MAKEQFKEHAEGGPAASSPPSAAADAGPSRAAAPPGEPRREAAALWRALAGMVFSLALACVIVAIEFSVQATHRANLMRARMGALTAKVRKLDAAANAEHARLSAARSEVASAQTLGAILLAPDLATFRLAPARDGAASAPAGGAPRAGGAPPAGHARVGDAQAAAQHGADAQQPSALLMFSRREGRAALQAAGLGHPARDRVFVLWWSGARGALKRAGEFRTAANGSALLTVALPRDFSPAAALVTVESAGADGAPPQGDVLLRGALGRAR